MLGSTLLVRGLPIKVVSRHHASPRVVYGLALLPVAVRSFTTLDRRFPAHHEPASLSLAYNDSMAVGFAASALLSATTGSAKCSECIGVDYRCRDLAPRGGGGVRRALCSRLHSSPFSRLTV